MGMGGPGSMPGMGMMMMMMMRRHGFPDIRAEAENDGGCAGRMMGMPRGGAMGRGMIRGRA
jgi:hypothetical protein